MTEKIQPANHIGERPPRDGNAWDCQCAHCGSSCDWTTCYNCEDGYSGHDCGEDCCCCLNPEDNVTCDICRGYGGWWSCLSNSEWCLKNPLSGREECYGKIEWFILNEEDV